ncbi:hypothetical protein C8Q72DRAFT_847416 [Fomitopsis betulina]|nr:hypothetical protein C8Q72DRAFT_847416 [Fomitopsis betulina]
MTDADTDNLTKPLKSVRAPEHLNSSGLRIEYSKVKGRGIYASRHIEPRTLIEISPVLLFTSAEYAEHGRHTVLDHYTFRWRDGRMALALGLGSLFNHSQHPNLMYTLDSETESIRYITTRRIEEGEELCIFYGHKLWFNDVDASPFETQLDDPDDDWGGLSVVEITQDDMSALDRQKYKYAGGNPQDVVSEDDLPFERIKLYRDDEEDELSAVRTQPAWVVDLPDARHTATMLQWLKNSGLETPTMSHLKRIRKHESRLTVLLALTTECPQVPTLPNIPGLSEPYAVDVASSAALTQISLKHKNTLWPTIYAPRKKGELEQWTRGRVLWACEAMRRTVQEARAATEYGELPIAAHVPVPYEKDDRDAAQMSASFSDHDTRTSTGHPLRHAVLNIIRSIADFRASSSNPTAPSPSPPSVDSPRSLPSSAPMAMAGEAPVPRNGTHYLLTSLTLFMTHEPCIMCSMALLHSRVKEVFYLVPLAKTGGCGSVACLPALKGVNHRFNIGRWRDCESVWSEEEGISINDDLDA